MVASFLAGDELIRRQRFSVAQTKLWVLHKSGGGDFIRPIIARGVAMPAKLVHNSFPPGKCGPEHFFTYKCDPGADALWSEVGSVQKLADVATKTLAMNFCEKKWADKP